MKQLFASRVALAMAIFPADFALRPLGLNVRILIESQKTVCRAGADSYLQVRPVEYEGMLPQVFLVAAGSS